MLFPLHFITYVMGLPPLYFLNSFSAGTVFRRQNMTSLDIRFDERGPSLHVRIWSLKRSPRWKGFNLSVRCLMLPEDILNTSLIPAPGPPDWLHAVTDSPPRPVDWLYPVADCAPGLTRAPAWRRLLGALWSRDRWRHRCLSNPEHMISSLV